ncbi:hypothetical protein Z664_00580 [Coxiella endosymbiont of Amblyomma americanum]|nr:hypothetical protein Z664_00580 [Coxiella endosymbiont of Amblyomma americanum]AUJ58607.1 hypothetical protein B1F76_00580 [Coxiella-like endosymbiont of Amblyomma americanum]
MEKKTGSNIFLLTSLLKKARNQFFHKRNEAISLYFLFVYYEVLSLIEIKFLNLDFYKIAMYPFCMGNFYRLDIYG